MRYARDAVTSGCRQRQRLRSPITKWGSLWPGHMHTGFRLEGSGSVGPRLRHTASESGHDFR
jgi:hypothetical protein